MDSQPGSRVPCSRVVRDVRAEAVRVIRVPSPCDVPVSCCCSCCCCCCCCSQLLLRPPPWPRWCPGTPWPRWCPGSFWPRWCPGYLWPRLLLPAACGHRVPRQGGVPAPFRRGARDTSWPRCPGSFWPGAGTPWPPCPGRRGHRRCPGAGFLWPRSRWQRWCPGVLWPPWCLPGRRESCHESFMNNA
jgi:hypothetical protein